jgi:anti-sigma regulatory factor (Ser/Thr protein kinase)
MADEHFSARLAAPSADISEPAERVWNLIGDYGPDVAGLGLAGSSLVPGVEGVSLSAGSPLSGLKVRFATDDTSALIEEFQLTLDEGPCRDAATTRQAVVAADLTTGPWRQRWPQFTPAALNAGVRAVFALPLHAGGVRHEGAVDLYRRSAGGLDGVARTAALEFAAAAAEMLTLETLDLRLTDAFTHRRHGNSDLDDDTPINDGVSLTPTSSAVLLVCWFDALALPKVRRQIRAACADRGVAEEDLYVFVLAVHEAMANVARHGGGHGQLLLWWHAEHLWCEITDHGPGIPAAHLPVGSPAPGQSGQRGLWLIRRACTSCKVTTDATGTRLLLGYRLNHRVCH